jgi:hypothetical protein
MKTLEYNGTRLVARKKGVCRQCYFFNLIEKGCNAPLRNEGFNCLNYNEIYIPKLYVKNMKDGKPV